MADDNTYMAWQKMLNRAFKQVRHLPSEVLTILDIILSRQLLLLFNELSLARCMYLSVNSMVLTSGVKNFDERR
jgi:hypothetical protein